jgi:hypothetical protein
MNFPNLLKIKTFLKQTFVAGLVISLPVYCWLRLIFYELPFSFKEDGTIIFKTILTGWVIFILLKSSFHLLLLSAEKMVTVLKPVSKPVHGRNIN